MNIDRYTCAEVFARLDDYLDRELDSAEVDLVRQHLETCEKCSSEYRFEAGVRENLKTKLRRIEVPASLTAKVRAALSDQDATGSG